MLIISSIGISKENTCLIKARSSRDGHGVNDILFQNRLEATALYLAHHTLVLRNTANVFDGSHIKDCIVASERNTPCLISERRRQLRGNDFEKEALSWVVVG